MGGKVLPHRGEYPYPPISIILEYSTPTSSLKGRWGCVYVYTMGVPPMGHPLYIFLFFASFFSLLREVGCTSLRGGSYVGGGAPYVSLCFSLLFSFSLSINMYHPNYHLNEEIIFPIISNFMNFIFS